GHRRSLLLWRLRSGLLADHVLGIPVRPVLIVLTAHAFFVFTVRGTGATERSGEIGHGGKGGDSGVDAASEAGGDLLQEPAVAVGVFEGGEGAVAAAVGVGPGGAVRAEEVRFIGAVGDPAFAVEGVTDVCATAVEFGARSLD